MTVYASKPEINVREKLKELDKPSGIAGEAMLRAETPQEQFNLIGAGRKNLIINGNFKVQQRGSLSTATGAENNTYYVDRWRIRNSRSSSDMTTQIVTDDLPPHMAQGNAYKVTAVNNYGTTQHLGFVQVIEDTQQLAGETVTYSAWMKSNTKVYLWIYEIDGVVVNKFYSSEPHPGDGQWHKLSVTATLRGHVNDQIILYVTNYGNSATGGAYHISTQHQLEFNNISTPFEYRSYDEELALCQRYFQSHNSGDLYTGFGNAHANNSAYVEIYGYEYIKEMRAPPALSVSSAGDFSIRTSSNAVHGSATEVNLNRPGTQRANISFGSSGLTTGASYHIVANGTATATLNFDAEF